MLLFILLLMDLQVISVFGYFVQMKKQEDRTMYGIIKRVRNLVAFRVSS